LTIKVGLPRPHPGQRRLLDDAARFKVVACGRRWGKTTYGALRLVRYALAGQPTAWFAPTYRFLQEPWRMLKRLLLPVIERVSETERRIEVLGGGTIEAWSLDDGDAGRGSKYAHLVVDEAALVRDLDHVWHEALRPTLTDLAGSADMLSTPKGRGAFFGFFSRNDDGWRGFTEPSGNNPHLPPGEIEAARSGLPERAFRQEYLAEFVDDAGAVFRDVLAAIDAGRGEQAPKMSGRYVAGLDVARTHDWTVLTVLEESGRQVFWDRFRGASWERLAERVLAVATRYACPVVVDATGLGDPVCELLVRRGVRVVPFKFTGESKPRLMESLAIRLEQGSLRLMDIAEQTQELQSFSYAIGPSGHVRMEAPGSLHDDCVSALALAVHGLGGKAQVW
jgi:hypothetical protein